MAVQSFQDSILSVDKSTWKLNQWRELDKRYLESTSSSVLSGTRAASATEDAPETNDVPIVWTSPLNKLVVQAHAQRLWDTYLSNTSAVTQICVPGKVYHNTKRRKDLYHIYCPDIFTEACIDPLKTIKRDILPRFLSSELYRQMSVQLNLCAKLPPANELKVPPPSGKASLLFVRPSPDFFSYFFLTLLPPWVSLFRSQRQSSSRCGSHQSKIRSG
jgi:hypothetical protein